MGDFTLNFIVSLNNLNALLRKMMRTNEKITCLRLPGAILSLAAFGLYICSIALCKTCLFRVWLNLPFSLFIRFPCYEFQELCTWILLYKRFRYAIERKQYLEKKSY